MPLDDDLGDDDYALVRAYSEAYKAAGGENLPESAYAVLDELRDNDAVTPEAAAELGKDDALREAEDGDTT